MFGLSAEDIEDMPVVLQDIGVEEADSVVADVFDI